MKIEKLHKIIIPQDLAAGSYELKYMGFDVVDEGTAEEFYHLVPPSKE